MVIASCVALAALVGASAALAYSISLTPYGQIYAGGNLGDRHSITSLIGEGFGSTYACVVAINTDGSPAGTPDCEPPWYGASHSYNGTVRYGYIYDSPDSTQPGSGTEYYG